MTTAENQVWLEEHWEELTNPYSSFRLLGAQVIKS